MNADVKAVYEEVTFIMSQPSLERISYPSSYKSLPIQGFIVSCQEVAPRAIFQITHGMAEYWMRYAPFAGFLAQHGYVVCGHDDLGHGQTSGTSYPDGFFAPKNGADYVVDDIHRTKVGLNSFIRYIMWIRSNAPNAVVI